MQNLINRLEEVKKEIDKKSRENGKNNTTAINELVDEVVVVEEDEIAQGMLFLMENQKVVAEGAGAVTTAALLSGKYVPKM